MAICCRWEGVRVRKGSAAKSFESGSAVESGKKCCDPWHIRKNGLLNQEGSAVESREEVLLNQEVLSNHDTVCRIRKRSDVLIIANVHVFYQ